jgi:hypothetical protein
MFYLVGAVIAAIGIALGSMMHWEAPILWGGFLGIGGLVLAWPKITINSRAQALSAYEAHQDFLSANWFCFSCGHLTESPLEPGQSDPTHSDSTATSEKLKKCPFCAEEILEAAIDCKHCHHQLPGGQFRAAVRSQKPPANPLVGVAGILVFGALFLGFMGVSEFYGGSQTRSLYQGTVLEGDAAANRITGNAMSSGGQKLGFAAILFFLAVGAQFAGQVIAKRKSSQDPD